MTGRALPVLETARLTLTIPGPAEAPDLLAFHVRNRAHLILWSPVRPPAFYTLPYWEQRQQTEQAEFLADQSCCLAARLRDAPGAPIVAEVRLRNLVRGSFQACHLGYHVDEGCEGQGVMREALEASIAYAFGALGLHRIMANYIPTNARSGGLLRRLGFQVEGYARDYLLINGVWQDHILTALHNPDWRAAP